MELELKGQRVSRSLKMWPLVRSSLPLPRLLVPPGLWVRNSACSVLWGFSAWQVKAKGAPMSTSTSCISAVWKAWCGDWRRADLLFFRRTKKLEWGGEQEQSHKTITP